MICIVTLVPDAIPYLNCAPTLWLWSARHVSIVDMQVRI